uniref:Acetyl-coenzyme A carboxylase carboxyl transferase subunit alpha n=1 Tax=Pleurostichidium falkenbergii TaxID=121064 RepID=A0A4D6UXI9_9FLOR|nr:acetyl-CoA carboxylase, carboxyl transferase subunit alpha [Pleurostichidium falkenbergii]QCH39616.1 acetyl-CoA carboxylase, carboxyl transferase subunit alpha [Pleurostichidium falkenbergii]
MVSRKVLTLNFLKPVLEFESQLKQLDTILSSSNQFSFSDLIKKEVKQLKLDINNLKFNMFKSLTPLQRLHLVRQADRPTTLDYISNIMKEWVELHGDRGGTDDSAIVSGLASLNSTTVVFIGHQRGKDTKDNVVRNFGMASPGGYRKAFRLMNHANRFNFPILTFIDTPGAWAGIEAEELGQGEAIAVNLKAMFSFDVPIICTVIGEGGSGGALGIGVGDIVLMLEHAVYTVATPEACAAILWKDSTKSPIAAESLKITSPDLKLLGVVDDIIKEPIGGSQSNPIQVFEDLKTKLILELRNLLSLSNEDRKIMRYNKFRKIGEFHEFSL